MNLLSFSSRTGELDAMSDPVDCARNAFAVVKRIFALAAWYLRAAKSIRMIGN